MPAYKDDVTGKWFVSFYYRDYTGANKSKKKRGFTTKKEALEWEWNFKQTQSGNLEMTFENFITVYHGDIKSRIKHSTWLTKKNITDKKILPYFKNKKMNNIVAADVIAWQNTMIKYRDEKGVAYSPVYLKTLHNQLSAIFNHAVRFYSLKCNPAQKAGNMGKERGKEMKFWTKTEYLKFSKSISDRPLAYYAFEMLYWSGIRVGELLALTPDDIDFDKQTIRINKSYQRLEGKDYVTSPKTEKSNRTIKLPDFLVFEMEDYIKTLYKINGNERMFDITKSQLHNEMRRCSAIAGVEKIRIHDLRHSHVSLLIDLGFSAVAIADRVGHESIDVTFRYSHLFPSKQNEMAEKLSLIRNEE